MSEQNRHRRGFRVAIVGATGAVGETLLAGLESRRFPVRELVPLASQRSAGDHVMFRGMPHEVREAVPEAFANIDLVFFAATGALSQELAPEAVGRGAIVIDKSSTWRMNDDVPLVIPEINVGALDAHRGIVSCPNCTTIGVDMALEPIRRAAGLRRVVITTLQAVSGAGRPGSDELARQLDDARHGKPPVVKQFAAPIAHNVVPLCETFAEGSAYTTEELKLRDESRKILETPELEVSMTCVRVPVDVGHSAAIWIDTERPLSALDATRALAEFPGVRVTELPTPLDVAGSDDVLVGRIREDLAGRGLWLWQVVDNLRKGAATNALQIAEALVERGLLEDGQR